MMGEEKELMTEKNYKLRKLQACDIVPFAKIIGKIGIDEMVSCYADEDFTALLVKLKNRKKMVNDAEDHGGTESVEAQGIVKFQKATEDSKGKDTDSFIMGAAVATRIANKILLNLDRCMDDVFAFMGGLSGLPKDEVGRLGLDVFLQMVMDVTTENNVVNFIRAAMKFIE